jgi:phage recombination protein Bet
MSNVSTITQAPPSPPKQASLIQIMASKYNMDPVAFSNAVKKTAMPGNATNEEFAAFMMVAHQYHLNPILKEIHAFPKKGGGIVPVVSIDGWVSLINQHPQLDGIAFEMHYDDKKVLLACTCVIHRKDRSVPTTVTEYLSECYRSTDPWKMKHRMLRHKALIQCARYAFGFSGITDEDEGDVIANARDITPIVPPSPPAANFVAPVQSIETLETVDSETGEIETTDHPLLASVRERLDKCTSNGAVFAVGDSLGGEFKTAPDDVKRAIKDAIALREEELANG